MLLIISIILLPVIIYLLIQLYNYLNNKHAIINKLILKISKGVIIFILTLIIITFIKGYYFGVISRECYYENTITWANNCLKLLKGYIGGNLAIYYTLKSIYPIFYILPFLIIYLVINRKYKKNYINNKKIFYSIIIIISMIISYFIIIWNFQTFV